MYWFGLFIGPLFLLTRCTKVEEKIRYSKWKAADIAKAFREGRKPAPGPAASETEAMPAIAPEPAAADEGISPDRKPRSAWVSGELEGQPSPQAVTPPPVPPPRPLSAGFTPPSLPAHQEVVPQPSIVDDHHLPQFPDPPPSDRHNVPQFPDSPPPPDHYNAPQFPELPPPSPPPIPSAPPFYLSPANHQPAQISPIVPSPSMFMTSPPMTSAQVELTPSLVVKVQKHCRYAISALDYEDAEQARKELRAALALLGG